MTSKRKRSVDEWVRSRPGTSDKWHKDHPIDDNSRPVKRQKVKVDLSTTKDWIKQIMLLPNKRENPAYSEGTLSDGFLPPSKKHKPFLNSINMSSSTSAKCKFTWWDKGNGVLPDTFPDDQFVEQIADAPRGFVIHKYPSKSRAP